MVIKKTNCRVDGNKIDFENAAALIGKIFLTKQENSQFVWWAANGGSIAIGHPFGMTGSRMTGTLLRELKHRGKKYGVVTMCIGGGQGASALFEAI